MELKRCCIVPIYLLLVVSTAYGLQCPSCTYITTDANIPDMARSVIDTLLNLFQDPECSKPLNGPIPQIKEETCSIQKDKVSRCSFYKGALTAKILSIEIPLKIYQRGCYYARPASVPSNGCHDRNSVSEDKTFFQNILDQAKTAFFSLDAITFKGELCVCQDTYCKYTSGVQRGTVISGMLLLVSVLCAWFLK